MVHILGLIPEAYQNILGVSKLALSFPRTFTKALLATKPSTRRYKSHAPLLYASIRSLLVGQKRVYKTNIAIRKPPPRRSW